MKLNDLYVPEIGKSQDVAPADVSEYAANIRR